MMSKNSDYILGGLIGGIVALAGLGLLIAPVKTILGVVFVGAVAAIILRRAPAEAPTRDAARSGHHGASRKRYGRMETE